MNGYYEVAQNCLNGHVINESANRFSQHKIRSKTDNVATN